MNRLPRLAGPTTAALSIVLAGLAVCADARPAAAQSAHSIYTRGLAKERQLRDAASDATLGELRSAVRTYELVVRRFPKSGYSDNALWQAANLAILAFERFNEPADRKTATRLLTHLREQYPSSSLVSRAAQLLRQLEMNRLAPEAAPMPPRPPAAAVPVAAVQPSPTLPLADRDPRSLGEIASEPGLVTIRDIKRTPLPDGVRVSIEMDGESVFRSERLDNPRRVFFDLKGARAIPSLQDATLKFSEDVVREIRLGRHPKSTTRVVMDMETVDSYSVFTLYNPFRIVVDFRRAATAPHPRR